MSDARFPERWLNDRRIRSLSADGFRSLVVAYAWSVANRTDGVILTSDVDLVPMFDRGRIPELIGVGVIARLSDGWVLSDYEDTQTTRAEFETLANARTAAKKRKARERAHKAGDHSLCLPEHCDLSVSRDSHGVNVTDTTLGQDRPGQDRTGITKGEAVEALVINEQTGEVLSTPAAVADSDDVFLRKCRCGNNLFGIELSANECADCQRRRAS